MAQGRPKLIPRVWQRFDCYFFFDETFHCPVHENRLIGKSRQYIPRKNGKIKRFVDQLNKEDEKKMEKIYVDYKR